MATGTIKRLVSDRGFGFIQVGGTTEEIFFHKSAVDSPSFDELREGEGVEFETEPDPRQPQRSRAIHIRRVD
jgi:CspA family cold shock protein